MAPLNQNSQLIQQPQQLVQNNPYLYYPNQQQYMIQPTMSQTQMQQYSSTQQMPNNPQQQNVQTVMSDRVWAQGELAAKAYLVAKNTEQVIWDSESPVIYIKTVDAYGRPTMVTLDYTIRPVETQNNGVANSEVNDLKEKVDKLSDMFEQFMQNQSNNNNQKTYKPNYNKKEVAN